MMIDVHSNPLLSCSCSSYSRGAVFHGGSFSKPAESSIAGLGSQSNKGATMLNNVASIAGCQFNLFYKHPKNSKIHATSPQPSYLVTIYRVFVILPMLGVVQYLCGPYSLCFLRMTFWSLSWNKTVSPALGALCSSKLKRRQRMLNVSPLWTAWNLRILEWPSDSTNHRGGAVQTSAFFWAKYPRVVCHACGHFWNALPSWHR